MDVDVDVRSGSFLLCPLLQGPCVGPLRSETNFLRRTPSTWRTGPNTSISPGSRQPYWRFSCHSFKCALARVPFCVGWLLLSRSTQGVKPADGGLPPICRHYEFPPVLALWLLLGKCLSTRFPETSLGSKIPTLVGSRGLLRWTP